MNNPLKYTDPSGNTYWDEGLGTWVMGPDEAPPSEQPSGNGIPFVDPEPDLPLEDNNSTGVGMAAGGVFAIPIGEILGEVGVGIGATVGIGAVAATGVGAVVIILTVIALNQPGAIVELTPEEAEAIAASNLAVNCHQPAYAKGDDNRTKAVKSYVDVIEDHLGKISNDPNNHRGKKDWEEHIRKAVENIKKELDKMGPAARQKALEYLDKAGLSGMIK